MGYYVLSYNLILRAKLSLPALEPIKGELTASCQYGETIYENKTDISLVPDVQEYYDQLEMEYEKCRYIINTYMAEGWREKKLEQLEKAKATFGVKDYQLFRKECWQFAYNLIMEEKESYLKESYAADTAIAYLEIYVYIGDVAFDIALMPVGGPIAGFLIGHAKSAALELISMRIERGDLGFEELKELIMKRIEQTTGMLDGAVSMPKPKEYTKLATWLACFFLYRFIWHWYWSTDENNNPVGITGALEKAAYDFAGKALSGLLGNFVEEIAQNSSFAQLSQKVYNKDMDEALAKPLTDLGDQGFNQLIEVLTGYLDKIKNGLIS